MLLLEEGSTVKEEASCLVLSYLGITLNSCLGKLICHVLNCRISNRVEKQSLRRLFCFGSLVILDVARCYLWLFTLYINIKISKNSC